MNDTRNYQESVAEITAAARIIGWTLRKPAKQHQRAMLQPITQRAESGPAYARPIVVLLAPRQVGKTQGIFGLLLARTALRRGYACAYTAQTGTVVTHVMSNPDSGWLTAIDSNPMLGARWRTARSQGREIIAHRTNSGAYIKAFPPVPGRLRSNALDGVVMDECQEHSHQLGGQLLADTGPVFTTRPRRQLILAGTAGETGSWWHAQVERARQSGTLVEIGSWPDDADPTDPAVWQEWHPGLRSGMTDAAHLQSQLDTLGPELFAREYGNRWTGGATAASAAIADSIWATAMTGVHPGTGPSVLAVDLAPDSQSACILALGPATGGGTVSGIVAHAPGALWIPEQLARIHAQLPRVPIVMDPAGPAAALAERLTDQGIPVQRAIPAERGAMHGYFMAELEAGTARTIPHPAMEAARAAAVRTFDDNGQWRWSRRRALGDITPLVAWTLAVWQSRKRRSIKPSVTTG